VAAFFLVFAMPAFLWLKESRTPGGAAGIARMGFRRVRETLSHLRQYRETAKYSFAMQIYLLNRRFQQHQEIIWRNRGGVQDRTIYEDAIFAKTLRDMNQMDPRDYETYVSLFRNLSNFMCRPNFIIYLDVAPEKSMERIRERSRGCETVITVDYLTRLYNGYEEFLQEISRVIPVLRVQWNEYWDVEPLAQAISREYTRGSFLREVAQLA
jgi:deoxyadenosine kinase